ncbi:MAG TPA: DUF4331 family protein [Candidatus Eremiobacteraceae bacterium]|nr:DUF4331 family protein [Candidatus Eremiobacteraceae bacterium]
MRIITTLGLCAVAIASVAAGACSSSSTTNTTPGPQSYVQIERLARPAVKEAFEAYARHDQTNRSSPFSDPVLPGDINSFMTSVAGRSAATANLTQNVLIPDVQVADLSKTGVGAGYLGVETSPAGSGISPFGGRGLHDDVIGLSLSVIFGNTLSALGLVADDGKESPCLATDNVPYGGKHDTATFPYVGSPR